MLVGRLETDDDVQGGTFRSEGIYCRRYLPEALIGNLNIR